MEDIPKCNVCDRRFQNIENVKIHKHSKHTENSNPENDHKNDDEENRNSDSSHTKDVMENSEQTGYGNTENYQLVSVQCKKCDETLQNNHMLRIHMRTHNQKKQNQQQKFKCTNCNFETNDENTYLNHLIDTHSTVHKCQTCNNNFKNKEELIGHIVKNHAFNHISQSNPATQVTSTSTTTTPTSLKQQATNQIKCFECGLMLHSRDELMRHKKMQHWKQKFCTYYHGTGRGCRFPDRVCFNIHRPEEQQPQSQLQEAPRQEFSRQEQEDVSWVRLARGQGQVQEVRSQEQEVRRQGQDGQVFFRDQEASWARMAGGQGQVQGPWGQGQDVRANIDCRDGTNCVHLREGNCRYRHQILNQRNQAFNYQINQTSENQSSESMFNMQEMKATLDNLVRVVYNLKSLKDFPNVNQSKPSN